MDICLFQDKLISSLNLTFGSLTDFLSPKC